METYRLREACFMNYLKLWGSEEKLVSEIKSNLFSLSTFLEIHQKGEIFALEGKIDGETVLEELRAHGKTTKPGNFELVVLSDTLERAPSYKHHYLIPIHRFTSFFERVE